MILIVLPQAQPRQDAPSSQFPVRTLTERVVFSMTSNVVFLQLLSFEIHTEKTPGVWGAKAQFTRSGRSRGAHLRLASKR